MGNASFFLFVSVVFIHKADTKESWGCFSEIYGRKFVQEDVANA